LGGGVGQGSIPVRGGSGNPVCIVLLPLGETPESVRIEWPNLWVRRADNVKTGHPLTSLP